MEDIESDQKKMQLCMWQWKGAREENIIGCNVGRHLVLNFDQMNKTQQNK